MLCLYWFGCTLESMLGTREFLLFYFTAALAAALAFIGLDLYTGSSIPAIGASGAVTGVMMLYTMHFPTSLICLFWLFELEMRWVMLLYLIWDLHPVLLALSGEHIFTGVANVAHLGGLAFGFVYARYHWRLERLVEGVSRLRLKVKKRRLRVWKPPQADRQPAVDPARIDQLLQKITELRPASLTEEERALLRKASEGLKGWPEME
jgi:hypothetical protein